MADLQLASDHLQVRRNEITRSHPHHISLNEALGLYGLPSSIAAHARRHLQSAEQRPDCRRRALFLKETENRVDDEKSKGNRQVGEFMEEEG